MTGLFARLAASRYLRDALALSAGTAVAQALLLAASPLLTRLYTPEHFGLFAFYVAAGSIIALFATGRLELALPLESRRAGALRLLSALTWLAIATCLVLTVLALAVGPLLGAWFGLGDRTALLPLLPLGALPLALYRAQRYWQIRNGGFRHLAVAVIVRAAVSVAIAAAIAIWSNDMLWGLVGLIVAQFAADWVNLAMALRGNSRRFWRVLPRLRPRRAWQALHRHRRNGATLFASQLFSMISLQTPIYLIGTVFGGAALGFYALAERVIAAPATLLSNALGDVFRQRAAAQWREQGRFDGLFIRVALLAALLGLVPYGICIVWGPDLFELAFGAQWRTAGEMVQVTAIAWYAVFVSGAVDKGALIVGDHRYIMAWHVSRNVGEIGIAALSFAVRADLFTYLWGMTAWRTAFYASDMAFEYYFARTGRPLSAQMDSSAGHRG